MDLSKNRIPDPVKSIIKGISHSGPDCLLADRCGMDFTWYLREMPENDDPNGFLRKIKDRPVRLLPGGTTGREAPPSLKFSHYL